MLRVWRCQSLGVLLCPAGHYGPDRQPNPGGGVRLHIAGSHYVVRITAFEMKKTWPKFRKAGIHCPEARPFASARPRSMEHDCQSQSCQDLPCQGKVPAL